jgi:hypothetical protein
MESKDIHYIEERLPNERNAQLLTLAVQLLMAADILLLLALLFGFWQGFEEKNFAKNSGLKRRRYARPNAEVRIRKMKKLTRSKKAEDTTEYFEEIDKTLTQYLSDKFGMSAFGITRYDLERKLLEVLGETDPLYQEIMALYQLCDESRFAKASVAQEHKARAMKILKQTISRVEKVRIK